MLRKVKKPRLIQVGRYSVMRVWFLDPLVWEALWTVRSYLPCPRCTSVGTFKPHEAGDGRPRRWLCKYCGLYLGPDRPRAVQCHPSSKTRVWSLPEDTKREPTPLERLAPLWPWKG